MLCILVFLPFEGNGKLIIIYGMYSYVLIFKFCKTTFLQAKWFTV